MTQKEKSLLLKDLCARLPYGVFCNIGLYHPLPLQRLFVDKLDGILLDFYEDGKDYQVYLSEVKPYLRPMSSMTEEEKKELERLIDEKLNRNTDQEDDEWTPWVLYDTTGIKNFIGGERFYFDEMSFIYDWLNAHHFDFRNLIGKGLAIEVTKKNNPYEIQRN